MFGELVCNHRRANALNSPFHLKLNAAVARFELTRQNLMTTNEFVSGFEFPLRW